MIDTSRKTVAQYLTFHINNSEKTQRQIALEIGYTKPNIITMFKQGATKLPLDKIGPLAKALEIAPDDLFFKVMTEYMPDTFEALSPFLCGQMLSKDELEMLDILQLLTHQVLAWLMKMSFSFSFNHGREVAFLLMLSVPHPLPLRVLDEHEYVEQHHLRQLPS